MNKKILTVIIAIILFIPSFVAVGYYSSTKKGPEDSKDVSSLVIEDAVGTKWQFSSDDGKEDSNRMIEMFMKMKSDAIPVAALPEAMTSTPFFRVTLTSFGNESSYRYYFTTSPSDAYIVDTVGSVAKISEEYAADFLKTQYSVSLYSKSSVPQMIVAGEDIIPFASTWNYQSYDGSFKPLDTSTYISDVVKTCSLDDGIALRFTEAPDYIGLKVYSGDEVIFDKSYENIDELSFADHSEFTVEVNAEWYQSDSTAFYGTASYRFNGAIIEPPVFYLGQTSVENGKFVCIGGRNVDDPEKITFSSEPDINYTPVFYKEGDFVYALVPISYDLPDKDQVYVFTITYGGTTQSMNLNVTPYGSYKEYKSDITKGVVNAAYTEEAQAEMQSVLSDIAKTEVLDTHAFSGTFLEDVVGADSTGKISPGFGKYMKVKSTGTEFRHTGTDYKVKNGTEVYALNDGEVVYSGVLTATGYIVVIDHGWGLKSWYCHLSENKVAVGDKVSKGDLIGLAGDTGFTTKERIHVALSVFDVPVCVYKLWSEPVQIPTMNLN